jgi:putative DNA primase/helicase
MGFYIEPDYDKFKMLAVSDDGMFIVSNLLRMTKVKVASHGSNQSYLMTLEESSPSGVLRTFDLDFTEFNASMEAAGQLLNKNGFVISSFKFTNHFRDYIALELQGFIERDEIEYYHRSLGFTVMTDGTRQFLLGDALYRGRMSTYIESTFRFKQGQPEHYEDFLVKEILPHFETRLALNIGLSSIVASDLGEYADTGTVVLNLSGQSSTGKTTIMQFMASLWGSPKVSNKGITRTFNATTNSLIQTFAGINGVPIMIDDATSMGVKDLSSFIYNIAAGEDKLRLTSDIQLRESKGQWSGLVAISSETSIMDHSTKTGGSIPRLLEFDNITWTQSAIHAKSIKRAIQGSYGFKALDFIKHYRSLSVQDKRAMFNACEDELDEMITVRDQYTNRIVSKLAVIYMTAQLIEKFYAYASFSSIEIRDYLVTFEHSKVPVRSIESQALDIIKTFIVRNQHRMSYKANKTRMMELISSGDFIGYKQYVNQDFIEVTMISQVLSNELLKHNITQWSSVLRYLEKQPFVKTYGKSQKASETDNLLHVKTITFRFQRSDDEIMRWYYTDQGLTKKDKNETITAGFKVDDESAINEIFE